MTECDSLISNKVLVNASASKNAPCDEESLSNSNCTQYLVKQLHLKFSRYFEKLKQYLGGFAIFLKPSHAKVFWKIAESPKYCFSFSKQRLGFFFFLGLA